MGSILNGYSVSREGYGEYSLNLNSIFNPSSLGGYTWSVLLPKRPQLFWQFDGFNYLGAGVLTGMILVCILCLVMIIRSAGFRKEMSGFLKRNGIYAVCMLLITLFAISNVICFDDIQLAQSQFPDTLMHLFGIFRASSRMFYPVSYTILLSIVVGSDRILKHNDKIEKFIPVFLCMLLALQAVDLSKVIAEKHNKFKGLSAWGDPFVSELSDRMDDYELLFLPIEEMGGIRNFIIEASKHGLKTNGFDANTGTSAWDTAFVWTAEVEQAANNGILNEDYIYATHDESRYEMWENLYRDKADFIIWNTKESGCFDINEK